MNVLDIFSGIGGFSLGLERAGMRTVAFCEIEPYARAVLRKHWPGVMQFTDIRLLNRQVLEMFDIGVDVVCGGFPCQDISLAGKGAGLDCDRSGLWSEYFRLIEEIRPRYAIIENVSALRSRGLETILGQLAAIGYDAEWHCIPASAVGAPHRRDRIWVVAYAGSAQARNDTETIQAGKFEPRCNDRVADADVVSGRLSAAARKNCSETSGRGEIMADAFGARPQSWHESETTRQPFADAASSRRTVPDADSKPTQQLAIAWGECRHWLTEPDVGRVANGVPALVDRLRCLGNAVVPQIPEIIGRAIMRAEGLAA